MATATEHVEGFETIEIRRDAPQLRIDPPAGPCRWPPQQGAARETAEKLSALGESGYVVDRCGGGRGFQPEEDPDEFVFEMLFCLVTARECLAGF